MATIEDVFNSTLTKLNTEISNASDPAVIAQYVNQLKAMGDMMTKHYNIDLATWDEKISEIDAMLLAGVFPSGIKANTITNQAGTGAPSFPNGLTITAGITTDFSKHGFYKKSVLNGGGSSIFININSLPTFCELIAHGVVGTADEGKYLIARGFKNTSLINPVMTTIANSGISISAVNSSGTVALTGFVDTNNIRMEARLWNMIYPT